VTIKPINKIYIASDHAGFDLKSFLKESLAKNFEIIDLGCNSAEISVDYPDYAKILCKKINPNKDFGILICGSGIGVSIAANRFKNIRAALCFDEEVAKLSRLHNDANVLCLGARFLNNQQSLKICQAFLKTNFEKGRHQIRLDKINNLT